MSEHVRTRLPVDSTAALTFDDGPDVTFTPLVLDELRRLGVRATFFLIGERAAAHPALVRRIVDEGHAIGSHSRSHAEPGTLGWAVAWDFWRGRRTVERAAGRRVRLFRPPKGYVDRHERVAMSMARVEPWLWTIDAEDWVPAAQPSDIVGKVNGLTGGDVVLLHDAISGPLAPEALDRSATVAALADLVALATERGLELVTLPGAQSRR